MKLTRDDWAQVLHLLDAALALPSDERERWLQALPRDQTRLRAPLAQLLAERRSIEAEDFLGAGARLAAAAEGDDDGFAAGAQVGPYRLLRRLGRGGMATVWLAERADGTPARAVALKLPLLAGHARVIAERFARERDILAALSHPNIAVLIDAGVDGTQPWLATEFVDGMPLTTYCDRAGLDSGARLALFVQVLRALQHAHAQLVIHRDLKPSNVLVDTQGRARLLDFGVAKLLMPDGSAAETALTQWGGRAMTPLYASPEQLAGRVLATTTDVYSAGVLLYELLTGVLPHRPARDTAGALEEAILGADIVAPSAAAAAAAPGAASRATARAISRALRGDVDVIVLKALAREPGARYGSAAALADDIEHHLARRPITARAPSRGYVVSRFVLRHRVGIAAAAAVVVAGGIGVAATVWQMQRAEREAVRALAIKDFLVSVFRVNDPRVLRDRPLGDVTARELLELSAGRIETEFAHDPPTAVELLGVTSEIYGWLLDEKRYAELSQRRLALARAHYGERHPLVVDALLVDVWSNVFAQHRQEALRQLDAIDQLIGVRAGLRSVQAAEWWLAHAQALQAVAGVGEQRMQELLRAAAMFEQLDPRHPSLAAALANAGNEYLRRDQPAQARDRYRQAIEANRRQRQPEAGDLAMMQRNLARALHQLGDHDQAARTFGEAERLSRAGGVGLPTHWLVVEAYARFLHRRGQREAAHRLYDETLPLLPAQTGSGATSHDAMVRRSWGEALLAEGRAAEALAPLAAVYRVLSERPDSEHDRRYSAVLLARAYAQLGRRDEARRLFREAVDAYARSDAPRAVAAADARVRYAQYLAAGAEAAAARAEFEGVVAQAAGRPIAALALAQIGLAGIAAAAGDAVAALRHADEALATAERLQGAFDLRVQPEVWRGYAALALARGDRDAARRNAERALQASERLDGVQAPSSRSARWLIDAASRAPS